MLSNPKDKCTPQMQRLIQEQAVILQRRQIEKERIMEKPNTLRRLPTSRIPPLWIDIGRVCKGCCFLLVGCRYIVICNWNAISQNSVIGFD